MGLNISEIDKVFYINICCFCNKKTLPNLASLSHSVTNTARPCQISRQRYDQNNLVQYGRRRHVEFTSGLYFDTFSRLGRQNASAYQISCKSLNILHQSVYLSVCPSHIGIVSKRLKLLSNCLHCLVAP